jgi:hypothetical protein
MLYRKAKFKIQPIAEQRVESAAIGDTAIGNFLDWLLGYESTRFKQFLKQHGEEKITSMKVGRVPIAKAVRLGFDILSGGAFEQAHSKLGVDNFFHLFLVINNKHLIEKNETVNYKAYTKASNEENMDVPVNKDITIDQLIQTAQQGNSKSFWLEYNPLSNNCQMWVNRVLTKNGLSTSAIASFVNQDMEALLNALPHHVPDSAKNITDVASYINRIIQFTTGGRAGFAVGTESLGDRRKVVLPIRKGSSKGKSFGGI